MDSNSFTSNAPTENVDPNVQAASNATQTNGKDALSAQGNVEQKKAWDATSKDSTISSLEDLRSKSPELFKKMMEGIAQQICREMKDGQDRIKKNLRGK
jgi:hypothetical protein